MTDLLTENARLRAALEEALRLIDACINEDVTETTDWEKLSSDISSILATPAPDAVQEAARDGDDTPIKVLEAIVRQIDQGGEDGKVFARDNCIARARKFISEAQGKAK